MAVLHRGVLESYLGIYAAIAPSRALGDQTKNRLPQGRRRPEIVDICGSRMFVSTTRVSDNRAGSADVRGRRVSV